MINHPNRSKNPTQAQVIIRAGVVREDAIRAENKAALTEAQTVLTAALDAASLTELRAAIKILEPASTFEYRAGDGLYVIDVAERSPQWKREWLPMAGVDDAGSEEATLRYHLDYSIFKGRSTSLRA
jgi:hypothetical protein